jgi:hypothetical protein
MGQISLAQDADCKGTSGADVLRRRCGSLNLLVVESELAVGQPAIGQTYLALSSK